MISAIASPGRAVGHRSGPGAPRHGSRPPERPETAAPAAADRVRLLPDRPADGLPPEPTPLPEPVRAAAASRAFASGNGYLAGLIVDRRA
jgi:hypothetical protein